LVTSDELGWLIFLSLAAVLSFIYAKRRAVVILPALMLASLLSRWLGLKPFEPLLQFSSLATALLVFIVGLELNVDFVRREKERIVLMSFFEFLFMLSIFYVLRSVKDIPLSLAFMATIIASNEAFALAASNDPDIRALSMTISVFEDSFAVFLLSIGFFSSAQVSIGGESIENLMLLSIALMLMLIVLAKFFNKLVRSIEDRNAKILLSLLYLLFLIVLADLIKLPEALVVFIGGLALAIHGFDEETTRALETYMSIALMGFVMSLPYVIQEELTSEIFMKGLAWGLCFSIIAFIVRSLILSAATFLSGLDLGSCLILSLSLANMGEFGLLVVFELMRERIIPAELALGAMFAYAFNLTLVSLVVRRMDYIVHLIRSRTPSWLIVRMKSVSAEIDNFIRIAMKEESFRSYLYELVILVAFVYIMTGVAQWSSWSIMSYLFSLIVFGAFIAAIYIVFQRMSELLHFKDFTGRSFFLLILRYTMLYVILAPLLVSLENLLRTGSPIKLSHPISLFFIFISAVLLLKGTKLIASYMSSTVKRREVKRTEEKKHRGD